MQPSKYQQAIYDDVVNGSGHTIIKARAGCGKTFSILQSFKYIPSGNKTLMVAFNRSIANELREKAPSYVDCSTMHSLGLRAIKKSFGDVEIDKDKCKNIVENYLPIASNNFGIQLPKNKFDIVNSICQCISLCKSYLSDLPRDIEDIIEDFDIETFDFDISEFISIVIKVMGKCKENTSVVDFDDMIWFPFVFRLKLKTYDYVYCDEVQDFNKAQIFMTLGSCKKNGRILAFGDPKQCVDENSIVRTEKGNLYIKDVVVGEKVLSFRNGKNEFQTITKVVRSDEKCGVKITTESGKSLTMTPSHQIWASPPEKQNENQVLVYLMYRKGFGFRVGVSNKAYTFGELRKENNISFRLNQEGADKLWILDFCNSRTDALLKEEVYSLEYSIPTAVFNGKSRGLNQDYINSIFKKFGDNGFNLLSDKCLNFNLPHWQSYSAFSSNIKRNVICFLEHSSKNSQVLLEWSNDSVDVCSLLDTFNIKYFKAKGKNRFRLRQYFTSNKQALYFCKKIQHATGFDCRRVLSNKKGFKYKSFLLTAASLFVGMKVVVKDGDFYKSEKISNIENVDGNFYDIEVDDSCNFYANDILSHNCIYSFRGADSNAMSVLKDKLNAKELSLPITYRCPKKITYMAQKVVPDITHAPFAKDGEINYLNESNFLDKVNPGDFILSRTNAPLIKFCLLLLKQGVPANINGRDIGKNLINFVKKSKKKTVKSLISYTKKWRDNEIKRVQELGRKGNYYKDKAECIFILCENSKTINDVLSAIKELFGDADNSKRVLLSTTHKIKGMEADKVYILEYTYRFNSKSQYYGEENEEANIWYVAITRAKDKLFLVNKNAQ